MPGEFLRYLLFICWDGNSSSHNFPGSQKALLWKYQCIRLKQVNCITDSLIITCGVLHCCSRSWTAVRTCSLLDLKGQSPQQSFHSCRQRPRHIRGNAVCAPGLILVSIKIDADHLILKCRSLTAYFKITQLYGWSCWIYELVFRNLQALDEVSFFLCARYHRCLVLLLHLFFPDYYLILQRASAKIGVETRHIAYPHLKLVFLPCCPLWSLHRLLPSKHTSLLGSLLDLCGS